MSARHDTAVLLSPAKVIAPVGSEVVMLAGVCGKKGYLLADERVEWTLDDAGVGQFVEVGKVGSLDWLRLPQQRPRKISNRLAIGHTSARYLLLTRGTPTPTDDVPVLRGQAWITVTSPVEGTSFVTAYAPEVYGWDQRIKTSRIYWVDAQWSFPPPAINPVGTRHTFTTSVVRHTDRTPIEGWRVRYEITDGPSAGFAPDGASVVEVATNAAGQASVELFQHEARAGTNTIKIEIIRPATNSSERLVVGTGSTLKTWTAPQLSIDKQGPTVGSVGATLIYTINVSNPGQLPATGLVITDQIPQGLEFASSTPPASPGGGKLQWQFDRLEPGQSRRIEVQLRAAKTGVFQNCVRVTASGGLTAQDCVTTTVRTASLEVRMAGPERAEVGQNVTFEITIINRGEAEATGLVLNDEFDPGFEFASAATPEEKSLPLRRTLDPLPPGQSRRIGVTLRAVRAGRACNRLRVTADGNLTASAEACVDIEEPARPSLSVRKTGPAEQQAGEKVIFRIEIENTGNTEIRDLRVADNYDPSLEPTRATPGFAFEGDDLVWQIDSLAPGRKATLQVECQCLTPNAQACNRVRVSAAGTALLASDEACLKIVPSQRPVVTLTLSDLTDPVQVGGTVVYAARVTNNGPGEVTRLQLVGIAPAGMRPLQGGTRGPTRFTIQGQTIRFQPIDRLPPGSTLAFEMRLSADRPGDMTFRVELDSVDLQQPIVAEETTRLFQPGS